MIKAVGATGTVLTGASATAAAKGKWKGQEELDNYVRSLTEKHGEPQVTSKRRIHNGNIIQNTNSAPDHVNSRAASHGNVILTNVYDFPNGPTINNYVARRGRNLFIEFDDTLYKVKVPKEPVEGLKKVGQRLDRKEEKDRRERFENKKVKEGEN